MSLCLCERRGLLLPVSRSVAVCVWVVWDEWGDEEYVYGVMGVVCGVCEGCVWAGLCGL